MHMSEFDRDVDCNITVKEVLVNRKILNFLEILALLPFFYVRTYFNFYKQA
jgi:hypothetical protein